MHPGAQKTRLKIAGLRHPILTRLGLWPPPENAEGSGLLIQSESQRLQRVFHFSEAIGIGATEDEHEQESFVERNHFASEASSRRGFKSELRFREILSPKSDLVRTPNHLQRSPALPESLQDGIEKSVRSECRRRT